jgi:hypothetical protein
VSILDQIVVGAWDKTSTDNKVIFSVAEFLTMLNEKLDQPISRPVLYNHLRSLGLKPVTYGRYGIVDLFTVYAWIQRPGSLSINSKDEFMKTQGGLIRCEIEQDKITALAKWRSIKTIDV